MIGINVIAITIIPIPPIHWSIDLQSKIDFGDSLKFIIIVDPVVVIPDILSKNESVILNCRLENINGNEPNIAMVNQERAVNRKACCKFNFLSWSKFNNRNNTYDFILIINSKYFIYSFYSIK